MDRNRTMGVVFENVELDGQGQPLITTYQIIASWLVLPVAATSGYFFAIALGLLIGGWLYLSPILLILTYVTRYPAVLVSGIAAFLVPGMIFGKFSFVKSVFLLHSSDMFAMAVTVAILAFPILLIVTRTIARACSPTQRATAFSFSLLLLGISLLLVFLVLGHFKRTPEHIFAFAVVGLIYVSTLVLKSHRQRTAEDELRSE